MPETATLLSADVTVEEVAHVASNVYSIQPAPSFARDDEAVFAENRSGRVLGRTANADGGEVVSIQELLPVGTLAEDGVVVSVPVEDCVRTGRVFVRESWMNDDGTIEETLPSVVVAASPATTTGAPQTTVTYYTHAATAPVAAPACSCQSETAAGGMPPVDPTVADPTPDILLAGLASLQMQVDALTDRCDAIETSMAASHEVAQVAAALRLP